MLIRLFCQYVIYSGMTCLHCGQLVAGVTRWLGIHWRAAKVICLDFQGRDPDDGHWQAILPAPSASGCARVLRVTCPHKSGSAGWRGKVALESTLSELPRWVAEVTPLCPNLVALHLRNVKVMQIPELPVLKHLILEECVFRPSLVASLQGLASLETLHMSGCEDFSEFPEWDLRACTSLRRVFMSYGVIMYQAQLGRELCLPPACTVALEFPQSGSWRGWVMRLSSRIVDLRLHSPIGQPLAPRCTSFMHEPQLSQLRHVTLLVKPRSSHRRPGELPESLGMAGLLGGLPQTVETLHIDSPYMLSGEGMVVVPASLRALRIRCVCGHCACSRADCCPPSEGVLDLLTIGLHAGLECLQLVGAHGLRDLTVQARVVDMDDHLAAEVAQRGRVLERCDVFDSEWDEYRGAMPQVQMVHIGQGPVQRSTGSVTAARAAGPAHVGRARSAWALAPLGALRMCGASVVLGGKAGKCVGNA